MRLFVCLCVLLIPTSASAQDASPWMVMTDGALFATVNHQGGARGGDEFVATNWLMGMATRRAGPGQLTLTGMLSLDPLTAGPAGYRELFQAGEIHDGRAIVDRQHPHDFLMQAAAIWMLPLANDVNLTLAGAPVGEPALGPVAFMHRASAADNPAAPLSHHTLDSTHIAMGVITAAVDRGPWVFETSLFHGAEPDDNRWDLMDPGALDSFSARAWFKPSRAWQFQVSHGFLKQPEAQEPGDVRRTTASASWLERRPDGFSAVTVAYGRNNKEHGAFNAMLAEATHQQHNVAVYGRIETLQTETGLLEHDVAGVDLSSSVVTAATVGAVRELPKWRGFELGAGADVTFYRVPDALTAFYGSHPVSFHLFVRMRPPEGHMGRMWNMVMSQPMR
jgi:hypothetical protein